MTIATLLLVAQAVQEKPQVPSHIMALIMIAAGLLNFYGAYRDWDWVVATGRGPHIIFKLLGRQRARIFQMTVGRCSPRAAW